MAAPLIRHKIDPDHGPATSSSADATTIYWVGWAKAILASAHASEQASGRCDPRMLDLMCWACFERARLARLGIF